MISPAPPSGEKDSLYDTRYSWSAAPEQRNRQRQVRMIWATFGGRTLVGDARCSGHIFLRNRSFASTNDVCGQTSCTIFYKQSLPEGCPPQCVKLDLAETNLQGFDLMQADLARSNLERAYGAFACCRRTWLAQLCAESMLPMQ